MSATTGGGSAAVVYPNHHRGIDILPRLGRTSAHRDLGQIQLPTPSNGGPELLNTLGGCGSTTTYNIEIDTAAYKLIYVKSNKTLVGKNKAVLYSKGLYLNGVSNIIIQNIAITNLSPAYVWGGDDIALTDTQNVWIDHVAVSQYRNLGMQWNCTANLFNRLHTSADSTILLA